VIESEKGDLFDFEKGQIVGVHLAGVYVIKAPTLLGVSKATVSKVMPAYMNHGKTTSVKRTSGWKLTLPERDRRTMIKIVLKNHTIIAAQVTAELNNRLEESVSTKCLT
jgi:hypothetical protein